MKQLMIVFVMLCVLAGCATFQTERYVDDNVFVSTRIPEIKIRVNSDFAYMGRFDHAEKAGFIKRQMYVFSAKDRAVASFFHNTDFIDYNKRDQQRLGVES